MQDRVNRRAHQRIPVLIRRNLATRLPLLREPRIPLHHLKRERRVHDPSIRSEALKNRRLRQALHREHGRYQRHRAHASGMLRHDHVIRPRRVALELVHGLRVKNAPPVRVLAHLVDRDIRELRPRILRPRERLMHRQGAHEHATIIGRERQHIPIPIPRHLLVQRRLSAIHARRLPHPAPHVTIAVAVHHETLSLHPSRIPQPRRPRLTQQILVLRIRTIGHPNLRKRTIKIRAHRLVPTPLRLSLRNNLSEDIAKLRIRQRHNQPPYPRTTPLLTGLASRLFTAQMALVTACACDTGSDSDDCSHVHPYAPTFRGCA